MYILWHILFCVCFSVCVTSHRNVKTSLACRLWKNRSQWICLGPWAVVCWHLIYVIAGSYCYLFVLLYSSLHLFILMLMWIGGFFFRFSAIIILLGTFVNIFLGVHFHEFIHRVGLLNMHIFSFWKYCQKFIV